VTFLSTGARSKPVLDEAGFQQLLAAAYVLQQHNDSLRAKNPRLDPAWIFSEIAETHSLVRAPNLDLVSAGNLIAVRLRKLTDADGVSIGVLKDGYLDCVAESGTSATAPGGSIAPNSEVATERLKNGREFHSSDAQKDVRLDFSLCCELGIGSLLAVPIQRLGEIAGLIELRWSKADAFHECDVRTCQLMAGLISGLLERETVSEQSDSTILQGAPQLPGAGAPTSDETFRDVPNPDQLTLETASEPASSLAAKSPEILAAHCRVCGRPFGTEEAFCGNCSMPRVAGVPTEDLQSKWASMWFMRQAQGALHEPNVHAEDDFPPFRSDAAEGSQRTRMMGQPVFTHRRQVEASAPQPGYWSQKPDTRLQGNEKTDDTESDAAGSGFRDINGNLRRALKGVRLRLRAQSKPAALVLASIVLLLGLVLWSFGSRPASSQLTWFESLLANLGLAEAPTRTPAQAGNPDISVWVDVHTALYYCPGSELYGKTPGGRFSSQRAAQQDQFEPATRIACK
jgi:GAF domain-containing protein